MDKIFVVTSNIAPYRKAWCEELANFFDVTIVYTKDHDYERDDRWLQKESKKCKIYKLNNDKDLYDPVCLDIISLIKNNKDSLFIFDGYGPKTNLLGLIYCKMKKIGTIVNVDGYPTERKKSFVKDVIKKIVISTICDKFTCSGEATKEHLLKYGATEKNIIIHNFSSIKKEEILNKPLSNNQKKIIRKELNIDTKKQIVLGVGRFLPLKRFEDLIMAVKRCKTDCCLYLLGGKPTEDYLRLINEKDDIHFIDFVLPEDVKRYYQSANLFVLPSETDVWGLVLNEAIANGLPVIASNSVVASRSLIKDNGYIFDTYDVDELSNYIDLCLNEENNKKMSINSLKIAKDYTIEGIVQKQLPLINEMIKCKI